MCNLWFFYLKKKCFILKILRFFVFWNSQVPKSEMSSQALLHKRSYSYAYFFCILSTMKMKCCQILVCCMTRTSNIFRLSAGDWKLVPGPFIILLKRTWKLAPVLQIVQKIPENFCPCLCPSVDQVWWLNELWFNQYIPKCILSDVLIISIMTSQIS